MRAVTAERGLNLQKAFVTRLTKKKSIDSYREGWKKRIRRGAATGKGKDVR